MNRTRRALESPFATALIAIVVALGVVLSVNWLTGRTETNASNVAEVCRQLNKKFKPLYEQAKENQAVYTALLKHKPLPKGKTAIGLAYYSEHPNELAATVREVDRSVGSYAPSDCSKL